MDSLRRVNALNLSILLDFYWSLPHPETFFTSNRFFDLLAGNSTLREQIIACKTEAEIRASWEYDLRLFKEIRKKYLLYPE